MEEEEDKPKEEKRGEVRRPREVGSQVGDPRERKQGRGRKRGCELSPEKDKYVQVRRGK